MDPEIERTLKRIMREKREVVRMEQLPMGQMEENREDDVGLIRGGSIHPDTTNMDTMLPPIRDYGRPSAVTNHSELCMHFSKISMCFYNSIA